MSTRQPSQSGNGSVEQPQGSHWTPLLSGGSSMLFKDDGQEARYIVHRSAATRSASTFLRKVIAIALLVAYSRCAYVAVSDRSRINLRFFLLTAMFAFAVLVQLYTVQLLRIPSYIHQHEWIRSVSLVCTFMAWLVLNILLRSGEAPRTSPLIAALYCTAIVMADGLRFYAASQLILLNLICFILATAGALLDGVGPYRLLGELVLAVLGAGLVPSFILASWEKSSRSAFDVAYRLRRGPAN